MRIGIVAFWFNRGQGVVARQLRSALDALGHETFVLGRPTKERFVLASTASSEDVWDQPGVTPATHFEIPLAEYERWIEANGIEVAFFDQNYGFDEIAAVRRRGVRTIARFVWERFSTEHIAPAREAVETIYSLTRAEQARYARLGIASPYVAWGCHPDLDRVEPRRDGETVRFHYHAGLLGKRKPYREVIEAFSATDDPSLRLVVKAQVERRMDFLSAAAERDRRIELVLDDLPTAEHLQLFADCDVCLTPARWEGLGLHLYEALAFGMPIVTNDKPPMDELVEDDFNGILVPSHPDGTANSGITAWAPDRDGLRAAMARLADPQARARLSDGAREMARRRNWERTVADVAALVEGTLDARPPASEPAALGKAP
jgi:glycosyltransferase involved in cell wall biosynthesis